MGRGCLPKAFDPLKKQSGRRRSDLLPRLRAGGLRFGTSLWNGGTSAETDIPLIRRQWTKFLFQEGLFSFLGEVQFWNSLEQDLRIGV